MNTPADQTSSPHWLNRLNQLKLPQFDNQPIAQGRLIRVVGMTLEAIGLKVSVGQVCQVWRKGLPPLEAEVVGFEDKRVFLMPVQVVEGIQPGATVIPINTGTRLRVGFDMLGRIVNGLGHPLDGKKIWQGEASLPTQPPMINPLSRAPIKQPLDIGIRAINALLTLGQGQRVGLFAGSGVGKSVLLGMMTRFTTADIVVVGLIGERGREVKEFIDHSLGEEGLARAIVVASPADDPPLLRLRAAELSTRLAEYFRAQGKNVLLLMDSLTRYAQAQREIALATGEPPATKGYPPSVFTKLPQLVERAGNGEEGGGSITAIYTVLTEGDDLQDPIADSARGILDGHIVLSRALAQEGQYPAIDITASVSRVMPNIVSEAHAKQALMLKQRLALYFDNKDFVQMGTYRPGTNPELDKALQQYPKIRQFIIQSMLEGHEFSNCLSQLAALIKPEPTPAQKAATTKLNTQ